jgi:hypothetical protein
MIEASLLMEMFLGFSFGFTRVPVFGSSSISLM